MQLGFEKSRKEGRVTERSHGTSSHREKKNITHERPTEVKSDGSSYTQEHTHIKTQAGGMAKVKEKNSLDFS